LAYLPPEIGPALAARWKRLLNKE